MFRAPKTKNNETVTFYLMPTITLPSSSEVKDGTPGGGTCPVSYREWWSQDSDHGRLKDQAIVSEESGEEWELLHKII